MMIIAYIAFVVLGIASFGLQYTAVKSRKDPAIGNNPQFLLFQRHYFTAYFPALLADWLQGPYLYKLYSHYGFQEDQIAVLYVCGFASTVLLGTWAPVAADRFGRKKLCVFFTVAYSLSCIFKLSQNYGILLIARLLSGVATSLLFSSFEAWYCHEHMETNDFPKEWIPVTFAKASLWNGIFAIVAGVIANILAEWFGLGPVAPFLMAIPCLLMTGIFVSTQWNENSSQQTVSLKKSFSAAIKQIVTEPKVFLIGAIQSLFESVMYIFVFIWTPILDPSKTTQSTSSPQLGIIFSSFMICIMIGSALFQILTQVRDVTVPYMLALAVGLATISSILCVFATHPDYMARNTAFLAFLLFEVAVGLYFPAVSHLSSKILPEANRRSISNIFRVPLNLISCVVLMTLHNSSFRHGNRMIFLTCAGLLLLTALLVGKLVAMTKGEDEVIKVRYSSYNGELVQQTA